MLVCTVYFVSFYRQSVKFVLKPSKCLAISKLLRTFAADLKTKLSPTQHGQARKYEERRYCHIRRPQEIFYIRRERIFA